MGHEWKPPTTKEDKRWDSVPRGGLVRQLLGKALLYVGDRLQAMADIMEAWDDDGVVGVRVTASDLHVYVQKLLRHALTGPRWSDRKTKPPLRQITAAIPAARLLKQRLLEMRVQLDETFIFGRPRPPTKVEILLQAEHEKEQLEDDIATLQVERYCHAGSLAPLCLSHNGANACCRHTWPLCYPFPLHPSTVSYSMI